MRFTHGALQRLIWNKRHGRVRLSNTESEQERNRKARCRVLSVRLTAPTLATSEGSCTSCAVTDSGWRAGSSRQLAASEANVGTPGVVCCWAQVPSAVKPREIPSARSLAAWLNWAPADGPRGERCSVHAAPSQ